MSTPVRIGIRWGIAIAMALGLGAVAYAAQDQAKPPATIEEQNRDATRNSFVWRFDASDEGTLKDVVRHRGNGMVVLEGAEGKPLMLPLGHRGYLGVHVAALTPELRVHLGGVGDRGVLVARVMAESPAERAGLAVGDLLLEVDDEPVEIDWDLKRLIAPKQGGDPVRLTIVRDGARWVLEAQLESRRSRTLDLAPLLRTDEQGRTLLVTPHRPLEFRGPTQIRVDVDPGAREDTTIHFERAFGGALEALKDEDLNELVGEQAETRRALEARIEYLERRLQEIEAQLEAQESEQP